MGAAQRPTRVIAGTDCGFDTSAGMGRVAEDVVWAKLKAMAEGARLASHRLGIGWAALRHASRARGQRYPGTVISHDRDKAKPTHRLHKSLRCCNTNKSSNWLG